MGGKQVIVIYDEHINAPNSDGKLTAPVIIVCIVVASAGLMFGYETGSYGILKTMEPFLKRFFPIVFNRLKNVKHDQFCAYDSQKLSAYASSLYIAGIFSAILAGRLTTSAGRKGALIIGGMVYLIGVGLQGVAVNLAMLTLGRVLIGFGMGFTNQAAPIYLVEMATTKWRGAIGTCFPLFFEIGAFSAKWINIYVTQHFSSDNQWRITLGLCGVPATIMTIISFFIPDTPSSLIQRGKVQAALKSLNQVRSVDEDTENELNYLMNYHHAMKNAMEKPYQILFERKYRPQLLLVLAIPAFRQLTGIHLISNLRHILFRSLSFTSSQAYSVLVVQGSICILSAILAGYLLDRVGRRILVVQAGIQIFICQLVLAIIMANDINPSVTSLYSKRSASISLFVMTCLNAAYSWSWGVINWVVPCEILSLEVRPAGQGLSLAFNFGFQCLIIQTVFPLLCNFRYGAFLFYAGWILVMTIWVILFMPESKRIPLESMDTIWRNHWYWKRFVHGNNILLKADTN